MGGGWGCPDSVTFYIHILLQRGSGENGEQKG